MVERNQCNEAGCQAACCYGSWFHFDYKEKTILALFPSAKKVKHSQFHQDLEPGVYYNRFLGSVAVRIVGRCPNLGEGNACTIHDNLPPDCKNLAIGSRDCSDFRRFAEHKNLQSPS